MYQVYLGNTLFPVAPEEIKLKIENQNERLSLINEGELAVLRSPGLTEIGMKLLLPARQYHFTLYESKKFRGPEYFVSVLERLKTARAPFAFSMIRGDDKSRNMNMQVTLETYSITEAAGDMGDVTADLELRQYIHFGTKVVKIKDNTASKPGGGSRPGAPKLPARYTIRQGDNLPFIAQDFYGSQKNWMKIYRANKTVLDKEAQRRGFPAGSGYHWIFPGTKITIPKL